MPDAKHAGADASFRASVLQNLGGAALLVALVAGMFWAIGMVGRVDDDTVTVADAPDGTDEAEPDTPPDPDPGAAGESDEQVRAAEDPEPEPEPEAEPDPEPEPEAEPDPEPEPEAEERIPPGEISVQVLDGYQTDGGAAAASLAEELDGAGYEIVARNPALRYEVTTVLWTSGNEDAGRQVAAAIGATEVREQPGNLSDAVAVHVVVGADRG